MNKSLIGLAILLLSAGTATAAGGPQAQQSMRQGSMPTLRFQSLDVNRDGYVTRQEIQQETQELQRLENQWQAADTNNDGRVTQSEFSAFEQRTGQPTQQGPQSQIPPEPENNPDP